MSLTSDQTAKYCVYDAEPNNRFHQEKKKKNAQINRIMNLREFWC